MMKHFCIIFSIFPQNALILPPSNGNFSRLGWWILDFSKPMGQGGLPAHSEPK